MNDALTEMLRGLRLDGVEYGRCRMATPWATAFPEQEAARFHFIGVGQAKLLKPSGEWLTLTCGDAVLLPRGHAHVLGSGEDVDWSARGGSEVARPLEGGDDQGAAAIGLEAGVEEADGVRDQA